MNDAVTSAAAYEERPSSGRLTEFVECIWWACADAGGSTAVLPDGCVDLLFERSVADDGRRTARVVGTMRQARVVVRTRPSELLGVRFRAGGAKALLQLDVTRVVDTSAVWMPTAPRQDDLETCQRDTDIRAAASALEHLLTRQIPSVRPRDRTCLQSAAACVAQPERSVLETADSLGISRQHLRKRVVAATGLGPKQLARIARFRRVASELSSGASPSAGLALENGYCDQAHMANEFRALCGTTPTAYARFHSSKTAPHSEH